MKILNRGYHYNKEYYKNIQRDYKNTFFALLRALYIKYIFMPNSALDVGCGIALLIKFLKKLNIRTYGIEISKDAIEQTKNELKKYIIQANLLNLPYKDNSFDVVISVNVFEHLPEEILPAAILECQRVCKKGMYIEVTTKEDITAIDKDPSHLSKLSREEWHHIFFNNTKKYKISKPFRIPIYKNGIFLFKKTSSF